jgi:predicted nucleotidyltransferase
MDLGHPLRVVTPTLDGDVLRVLAHVEAEFTPPEIHRMLGEYSVFGIRKTLVRLTSQGIVLRRAAGNASLYMLNRSHLAAAAIVELASMKEQLLTRLRSELDRWEVPCVHAVLFGSAARGDMSSESDIDLFVVRPGDVEIGDDHWMQQLFDLSRSVQAWTGNNANVLEYGESEHDAAAQDAVLSSIADDGIVLHGNSTFLQRWIGKAGAG